MGNLLKTDSWSDMLLHVASIIFWIQIYLMQKPCFDLWLGLTDKHFQHPQFPNYPEASPSVAQAEAKLAAAGKWTNAPPGGLTTHKFLGI